MLDSYGYTVRSYSKKAIFVNYGAYEIPIGFTSEKKVIEYIREVAA